MSLHWRNLRPPRFSFVICMVMKVLCASFLFKCIPNEQYCHVHSVLQWSNFPEEKQVSVKVFSEEQHSRSGVQRWAVLLAYHLKADSHLTLNISTLPNFLMQKSTSILTLPSSVQLLWQELTSTLSFVFINFLVQELTSVFTISFLFW